MPSLRPLDSFSEAHIAQLHALFQSEWWTKGRTLDDVRHMVRNSSLVVAFEETETGRLVAFCRLLTDFVFRATLYDVVVAADHRGSGLGRRLMEAVAAHPKLQRVEVIWLCCLPELIPFYEQWGFSVFSGEPRWMHKVQRQ